MPARTRTLAPGKIAADELPPHSTRDTIAPAPGKVTLADIGREPMAPGDALAYADWITRTRIDRRADVGTSELDDSGALATAFAFLEDARGGQSLPSALLARLGEELGVDLSSTRVHTDDRAAQAAAALGARAFTIGSDVFFAADAYDPVSEAGIALIAHEAVHVAQNLGGRVPTGARRVSRPDEAHEREADTFAARFRAHEARDPAAVVERMRRAGQRGALPFLAELEEHFGSPLDFVEVYTGEAAQIACRLMSASAFAVRNIVALADPSPQRERLMHELTHVIQMGSTRAPSHFAVGSLGLGALDSAIEQEAVRAPERPRESASPDTIHRDPGTTSSPSPPDLKKFFETFLTKPAGKIAAALTADEDRQKVRYGVIKGGYFHPRLYATSKEFSGKTYLSAVKGTHKEAKETDLKELHSTHGSELKLSKIKTSADEYIVYSDAVEYPSVVDDKSPTKAWKTYYQGIVDLKTPAFKWPKDGPQKEQWTSHDPSYTSNEDEKYRDAMRDAVAAMPEFSETVGHWAHFHTTVVKGKKFDNKTRGLIFQQIVVISLRGAKEKNFFVDNESGIEPIFDVETYGIDINDKEVRADGTAKVSFDEPKRAILFEAKALGTKPNWGKYQKQAVAYRKIITQEGKGYKSDGEDVSEHAFNHVIYSISDDTPKKEIAFQWYQKLFVDEYQGQPSIFNTDQCSIIPRPDGAPEFRFKVNPEFTLPLGTIDDPRRHYVFDNPRLGHPGIEFKKIDITVDEGKAKLKHGSMTYDLKAGDIEKQNVTKEFEPAKTGDVMATASGKLKDLKSSLDKVLGPVSVDVAIVDEGIAATLEIKHGSAKSIAGFTVDAITLQAKYTDSGRLSVDGKVGIRHTNGKIEGSITIGWNNGWSFTGEVTVKDGMIPGVSEFTATAEYENGKAVIEVDEIQIKKEFTAVTLTGTGRRLKYDTEKGAFSGDVSLEADLGLLGRASADGTIADNDLKKATFSYDSPEFKYPPKDGEPVFKGTVGGTLTYDSGKFSGQIRGTADLDIEMLKKLGNPNGVGLAVEADVHSDGSVSGSISTTKAIEFSRDPKGPGFRIPSLAATIEKDGAVNAKFSLEIVRFKYLDEAKVECAIENGKFRVTSAKFSKRFGDPAKDRISGGINLDYAEGSGFAIGGELAVKIREGFVAKGKAEYNFDTGKLDAALSTEEIDLIKMQPVDKQLFEISRKIPFINVWGLGAYIDIGFDLKFHMDFNLRMKPTITLEDLDVEKFDYKSVSAEIQLLGALIASIIGTPKIGVGIFVLSPDLLSGGGGLQVPITGKLEVKPSTSFTLKYSPDGGIKGGAKLGLALTFGITGAVLPYAEFSVLKDMWNPKWEGAPLAKFDLLKPRDLLNISIDLGGDLSKPKDVEPPEKDAAPERKDPEGDHKFANKPAEDDQPSPIEKPPAATKLPSDPAKDSPAFSADMLLGKLKEFGPVQALEKILNTAGEVWDEIKGFLGFIVKIFKNWLNGALDAVEGMLRGIADKGSVVLYLGDLVKERIGDTAYQIIQPLFAEFATVEDKFLTLLDQPLPTSPAETVDWVWGIIKTFLGVGFDSITALVSAIGKIAGNIAGQMGNLLTLSVKSGQLGVRRHEYWVGVPYVGFAQKHFWAAAEYKIYISGLGIYNEAGKILNPFDAPGIALYEVFEHYDVPHNGDPARDRWV